MRSSRAYELVCAVRGAFHGLEDGCVWSSAVVKKKNGKKYFFFIYRRWGYGNFNFISDGRWEIIIKKLLRWNGRLKC